MKAKVRTDMISADLHDVPDVARRLNCAQSTVWAEIAKGRLRAVKLGKRTKIPDAALKDFIASLPAVEPKEAA